MDAQESSAVATLSAMGFTFDGSAWNRPAPRMGRPRRNIDLQRAAQLIAEGHSVTSAAGRVGINRDELSRRLRAAGLMEPRRTARPL